MKKRKCALVAMSGGLDSSLAAAILKKQGYDVIGATMKLYPEEGRFTGERDKARCSSSGIADAKAAAEKLDIPHYVFDFSKEFKIDVIDYFCREYNRGATPNPCVVCNQKLKFGLLLRKAAELGCDHIATGHYAKSGYDRSVMRYYIKEGTDKAKDQSYFLAFISQEALAKTVFPLGGITKEKARIAAKNMGLGVHDKASSQEICFIGEHYADYLKENVAIESSEGDIVDTEGKKMGRHKGIHFYTIGQRKGMGIAHKEPLYVVSIDRSRNLITAGTKKDILKRVFIVENPNWVAIRDLNGSSGMLVKIRYGHKKAAATVEKLNNSEIKVSFKKPQEAITPGQTAVFYKKDTVLGGAWISRVLE